MGNGDRLDIPDISAPPRKPAGSGSFPGEPGHTLFKIVSSVRGYHVLAWQSFGTFLFPQDVYNCKGQKQICGLPHAVWKQLVSGYVKIFGEDRHLIVRDEAAALFDPQDGQVAALHAQELEPACKGGLGKPLGSAELLHFRSYDVFGCTVPVDFHIQPSLLKMKYMN